MTIPPHRRHPAHLQPPETACKYHDFSNTPKEYFAYHEWVEHRYLDGDVQDCCPHCKCWLFPEEMNKLRDNPPRLFVDLIKLLEDILRDEILPQGPTLRAKTYAMRTKKLKERSKVLDWK